MRLHRFYVDPEELELTQEVWVKSDELRNQWLKVFRYREGDEVVLFDGVAVDRLYKLAQLEPDAVKLELVTEFERKLPLKHVYLFWSLLKKDKNEWVIQKCTELGITNFIPVIAERSEKTGFNSERAHKIAVEAAEQCGRSDIPHIREPITVTEAISEYRDKVTLLICDEATSNIKSQISNIQNPAGVLIGPEGGWSDSELILFKQENLGSLHLGNLTLRAETAAIAAVTKLVH